MLSLRLEPPHPHSRALQERLERRTTRVRDFKTSGKRHYRPGGEPAGDLVPAGRDPVRAGWQPSSRRRAIGSGRAGGRGRRDAMEMRTVPSGVKIDSFLDDVVATAAINDPVDPLEAGRRESPRMEDLRT
ncbi:MAG: hypothetical protein BJ554DRAFT_5316 [Olpidium bornovanus]|uniref:Uncharacterized protein n=1 Tax=Olpidium bornovanus TaxID=278681 RepID=A0A8H8DMH4_9FUNG|nr:MAG: hypothetical protein BJ554DRAFT_5316 [Olpidium bornovanus]